MKILAICGRLILFFIYMGIVAISIIPMAIFAFITTLTTKNKERGDVNENY
jgi:hypothetical protein